MNKEKIYTVFERKDPMKFTIVITTYNRLDFLKRAINSALEQTIKCERIVVDDCSADGTAEYVKSLGDRLIYHRTISNEGHAGAINLGVKNAQGDLVKPMDEGLSSSSLY